MPQLIFGIWYTPMNKCPPQVLELVEHLKQTGTGAGKIRMLLELGCTCSSAEEFTQEATKVVPSGTLAKILAYLVDKHGYAASPSPLEPPPVQVTPPVEDVPESTAEGSLEIEEKATPKVGRKKK